MKYVSILSRQRLIHEMQKEFSAVFPFLRLTFYRNQETQDRGMLLKPVPNSSSLAAAGLKQEGEIEIDGEMTVGSLESLFKDRFGLNVQVFRQSGNIWLETVMTDGWTLQQQNDHGRELSNKLVNAKENDFDLGRGNW
ncbi:MAG: hypothetical protein DI535_17830 [Citrobacter freundii]|nr:MAG: hypothetical protein DI535_17830 [Citrobacter freundii]